MHAYFETFFFSLRSVFFFFPSLSELFYFMSLCLFVCCGRSIKALEPVYFPSCFSPPTVLLFYVISIKDEMLE